MPERLDVAVNLLWCVPGDVGGSEEYLSRQLEALAAVDPAIAPTLYVAPGFSEAHPELAGLPTVVGPAAVRRRLARIAVEGAWLRRRTGGADVIHHGGGTMPSGPAGPARVLTLHDLQWLRYPEYVHPAKLAYLRARVPRSVRAADVVAVPSEYVRGTVIAAYDVDPERVVVVPHGFAPPGYVTPAAEIRARYGLGDDPFVVFPAITHPHKNHRFALDLLAHGPDDLRLVLLGGRGQAEAGVVEHIERLGVGGRVVRPGRVPVADRDALLAAADALVFPSEYEGFGAPALEAMSLGTPVLVSDQAALPEVVGDGGHVLALEIDDWLAALADVRGDRPRWAEAGRGRAARYTPARSAGALAAAYRQAAATRRSTPAGRRIVVLCPHFDPDTAPTGKVMAGIVEQLAARGHRVDVVTALPWYRDHAVAAGWSGRLSRGETTAWGSVRRLHPFPGADRRNLVRRAAGFAGFTALATWAGLGAGGWGRRVDAVIAMSPPLTMGLAGRVAAWSHRAPLIFNIQDVFPDAAIETGAITNPTVIRAARWLERLSYRAADAVTVLSDDLRANVVGKVPERAAAVHTIPNFVDTEHIRPGDRATAYRRELGIGDEPVVLYAGNIGFSQSVDLMLAAARQLPAVTFLVNGDGAAKPELQAAARELANVRFGGFVAEDRLSELLATGDVHAVLLKRNLGSVSVPSKTYSILAAGRPVVAAVDPGTEIPRLLAASGAGVAVAPDDAAAFVDAVRAVLADPERAAEMGRRGRSWVVSEASPSAVGAAYERLVDAPGVRTRRRGRR